ncbi:MAG: insulinase family protein [Deltaproteobacteria bacterium]|nr:insulinase family protein [Deltaproteobacteria bacterium]
MAGNTEEKVWNPAAAGAFQLLKSRCTLTTIAARTLLATLCLLASIDTPRAEAATRATTSHELRIEYQKFVLDNGLTLIVHEDHKAPIVAVNVWYHVGSKNERPGKTGFAHLFEHLMFEGSENYNDEFTVPFDQVGATHQNATTNSDRTNYFEDVPKNALDLALWMESDRMGHLLGVISQERLDEQRGVVQNEKRQRTDQPYGSVFRLLGENAYPLGHPYQWPVIGSMEDLEAASLDDVRKWFQDYYGAANAVVTIAGDIDPEIVYQKIKDYFGDIPPGPPVDQRDSWIAERREEKRLTTFDRVPQTRIIKAWNVPPTGTPAADYLDIASQILSEGKSSRLYKRLVYQEQIATDVAAFVWEREIGSLFVVWATVSPGEDSQRVESILDEELTRFIKKGPTRRELARAKTQVRAGFIRGVESIGGFGGKADILARSEVYYGSPDGYLTSLDRIAMSSSREIKKTLQRWIHDGAFVLEVKPQPEGAIAVSSVDRTRLPEIGPPPEVSFPALARATLSNGLEIIVVERHAVPTVSFKLLVNAGYSADHGIAPGTARLTLATMPRGTKHRSALEISDALADLGAELSASSNLDLSVVELSALREGLDDAMEIFADVILDPKFSQEEFERQRSIQLSLIEREKVTPLKIALRVFPQLLYGPEHAYGLPFTGSGTSDSVNGLSNKDLRAFHSRWFAPNASTLVVVGDTTKEEIVPKLEDLFRNWKTGEVPNKNIEHVAHRETSAVYLIDRPGSSQSMVFAGHIAPPKANEREPAIEAMNELLGGSFNSRINRNLREDKHWSYGAHSVFVGARGQRPFFVYAPVQTDKTAESLSEIERELREIRTTRPPTADEIERAKNRRTLSLPGSWETAAAISASVLQLVRFGFEDDFWNRYPDSIRNLSNDEVAEAAREILRPDALTWVVVGDRSKIEPGIRALGFGEIHFIDADGRKTE